MFRGFWLLVSILIILTLLLFGQSLTDYFFQDDWFILNSTNLSTATDVLSFFKFRADIIYWRPVGMFFFFALAKNIFGLNPLGYHLITLGIHVLNGLLIALISFRLFRSRPAAFVSSIMYTTAAFHFMTLSWLSLSWNAIGTAFFLLAFYFYLIFREKRSVQLLLFIIIFFVLSLASSELALIFPGFVVLCEFFYKDKNKTFDVMKLLPVLFPIMLINLAYLYMRFVFAPIPAKGDYAIIFDLRIIINLFWYFAWLINIPEVTKYHFGLFPPSFSHDPTFVGPFKNYAIYFAISFVASFTSLLYLFLTKSSFKNLFFALSTLIVGIIPVIFLPQHTFPYYLAIPSIGFFLVLGLLSQKLHKIALLSLVISWTLTSTIVLSFTRRTHWIPGESAISKETVGTIKNSHQRIPAGSTIILYPATRQLVQSLMDQNALQVIFGDKSIKTSYEQDVPIKDYNLKNVYYFNLK